MVGRVFVLSHRLPCGADPRLVSLYDTVCRNRRGAVELQAGTVWVNCYNVFDAAMPFGGYKQSGWGREMGHAVLNNYLETKSVCIGL